MEHLSIWLLGYVPPVVCDIASREFELIEKKDGAIGGNKHVDLSVRKTLVAFAPKDHWFGAIMYSHGIRANKQLGWNYTIDDHQAVQWGEYQPSGHYNWHTDTFQMTKGDWDRKVSVVCLMNDPSEFSGGELKIKLNQEYSVPLIKGTVVAFPSILHHTVTPVLGGIRKTATMWITGPRFT